MRYLLAIIIWNSSERAALDFGRQLKLLYFRVPSEEAKIIYWFHRDLLELRPECIIPGFNLVFVDLNGDAVLSAIPNRTILQANIHSLKVFINIKLKE
jgi:hypothetical protein